MCVYRYLFLKTSQLQHYIALVNRLLNLQVVRRGLLMITGNRSVKENTRYEGVPSDNYSRGGFSKDSKA
jgi:hypothetical protein